MADDLNEKMEPEISEAAEAVEEAVKEEASAVVEAAEEKAIDAGEAVAAAAVTASAAGKEAAKEAESAAKAAKKAEEQAAKEAAKKQAAADKEAEKAKAAKEKADAKLEKKRQKRAAQQALIDACPPQYRPVSTSKYFWLAFLSCIPIVGFILTIFLSIAGRNRNVKNFEKAILAYYIIAIVIALIAMIVIGVALPAANRAEVIQSLGEIFGSVSLS